MVISSGIVIFVLSYIVSYL